MVLGPKSKSKIFNCFETIYLQACLQVRWECCYSCKLLLILLSMCRKGRRTLWMLVIILSLIWQTWESEKSPQFREEVSWNVKYRRTCVKLSHGELTGYEINMGWVKNLSEIHIWNHILYCLYHALKLIVEFRIYTKTFTTFFVNEMLSHNYKTHDFSSSFIFKVYGFSLFCVIWCLVFIDSHRSLSWWLSC